MDTDDLTTARIEYVRLTNNLPFAFTDRYDGVPFTVLPGKSENFPADVAAHFFGYDQSPAAQMRHVAKRQGWNTPEFVKVDEATGKNKAQAYFDMLEIKQIAYKLVPVEDGLGRPREPIPADPEVQPKVASEKKPHRGSAKQHAA
jgi:hypothetical protein